MNDGAVLDAVREALWVTVAVSTPMLAAALVLGVAVGLFQALTSIQEMTLTFVPKLLGMGLVMWFSLGYMSETLVAMFENTVIPMIAGM